MTEDPRSGGTPRLTDCNSFHGVVPPLRRTDTARAEHRDATLSRKVLSRGEEISEMPCANRRKSETQKLN